MVANVFWVIAKDLVCGCLGGCQAITMWLLRCFGWLLGDCCVDAKVFWVARSLLCSCQGVLGGC